MKTLSVIVLFAAAIVGAMLAQEPGGILTSHTAPDPATMVANKVARLTSLLTLTTSQAAQATTIFTNEASAVSPLETNLTTAWTNMQAAVKSNAASTIDSLAAQIGTLTGQIAAIRNKADAAFYAILTTDQQTKLNSSRGFGGRGGPGGRGLGGGFGPGRPGQ
jgi:Spy/CpxP family protein refolding chaperone